MYINFTKAALCPRTLRQSINCIVSHCIMKLLLCLSGVFHAEREDDWKAGSENTEGRVFPDRRYVEQR